MKRLKNNKGFNLIELMLGITLFSIMIALSVQTFPVLLKQSTREFGVTKTEIEGMVGMDTLRFDLESAGTGLATKGYCDKDGVLITLDPYNEATGTLAATFNDTGTGPPTPIRIGNNVGANDSDYIVVKSVAVGMNDTSQGFAFIYRTPDQVSDELIKANVGGLKDNDRVILLRTTGEKGKPKYLVISSGQFFTTYGNLTSSSGFVPNEIEKGQRYIAYGVAPEDTTSLRFPFNRADYYIGMTSVPTHCAAGTGVLYKATVNHGNGALRPMPVLNCIADMQVVFKLDLNNDGIAETTAADLSGLGAVPVREAVKEVQIYILAQEGNKETGGYKYPKTVINVAEGTPSEHKVCIDSSSECSSFDRQLACGSGCRNYRWKVYTFTVKPGNLL